MFYLDIIDYENEEMEENSSSEETLRSGGIEKVRRDSTCKFFLTFPYQKGKKGPLKSGNEMVWVYGFCHSELFPNFQCWTIRISNWHVHTTQDHVRYICTCHGYLLQTGTRSDTVVRTCTASRLSDPNQSQTPPWPPRNVPPVRRETQDCSHLPGKENISYYNYF